MTEQTLAEVLNSAAYEINKTNGGSAPAIPDQEGPRVGQECADRLRKAAETTALAIEAQAEERMTVALSCVEEAKIHAEQAKKIADDVRKGGETEAMRALDLAQRLHDSTTMMEAVQEKFAS